MKPQGVIYDEGKSTKHGELILLLPFFLRIIYQLIRSLGAGMIAFAFLAFMFSYGPIISQEISFKFKDAQKQEDKTEELVMDYTVHQAEAKQIIETQKEASVYGVTSYFSVVIPKIDAAANIIANVDPSNKKEYLGALQKGVAHAKGTNFPGQNGRVFLFSHSTDSPLNFARYNAIFYLLKKLEKGDKIVVFFADKKYVYEVTEIVPTSPKDTSWIEPKEGNEELVLMTCDPPGTTWNRLLVIAKPIKQLSSKQTVEEVLDFED